MHRCRLLLLVAMALVVLPACEVDVDVRLEVARDGTGALEVVATLDAEAASQVDLGEELRVGDLRDAGWHVEVTEDGDEEGGAVVTARKRFAGPEEAEHVLRQVAGKTVLRDLDVDQDRTLLRTTTRLHAVVDLTDGLQGFGDDELTERLGGIPLGVSTEEIEAQYGIDVDEAFSFSMHADLPGGRQTWQPEMGERIEITTTEQAWNRDRIFWLVLATASTLALLVLVATGLRRRRLISWS